MKACREFEPLLVQYADDETDADLRRRVESHLAACPACAKMLNQYRASLQRITEAFADTTPPDPVLRYQPVWRVRRIALASAGVATALLVVAFVATRTPHAVPPAGIAVADEADLDALNLRVAQLEDQLKAFQQSQKEWELAQDRRRAADAESIAAITLAAGIFLEERQGNTAEAVRRYEFAADRFPSTRAGQEARSRLQQLKTASTGSST